MRLDDPRHYDVLVIGAGPAGTSAALRAAELGARVAVIEAERTGGTCVNTGCVPTRVLAKTARLAREVRIAHRWGLAVSDPVIDWASTVSRVRATVDEVRELKSEPERFARAGIDLVLEGRARFTDAHTLELDTGRRLTGDSIIVAVGGHSRPLPVPGAELATVPEHVLDLPELPARVAIIGAGNTGAQLVTVFSAFGTHVTLLDVAPRILAVADEQISDAVGAAFAEQGVALHPGIETVEGLTRADDGSITLTWREAGASISGSFDAVVMATGWPADVEGLGLEAAGVQTVRSAIPVDQYFRSSVPHIYAVGDANGRDMLVQAAHFEGEAAAENAVLDANKRTPHHLLPSGGFTDPDYAGVGLTEAEARARDPKCIVACGALHRAGSRGHRRPHPRLPEAHRRSASRADPRGTRRRRERHRGRAVRDDRDGRRHRSGDPSGREVRLPDLQRDHRAGSAEASRGTGHRRLTDPAGTQRSGAAPDTRPRCRR